MISPIAIGTTYANKLQPFLQLGQHMRGLSFTLKSFHGDYECRFNMRGPDMKPTRSTIPQHFHIESQAVTMGTRSGNSHYTELMAIYT